MKNELKSFGWLVIVVIIWVFVLYGCSVNKNNTHHKQIKPSSQLTSKDTLPDFFYINNQIVMIDKQR
jgi:hypothetical protein